MKTKMKHTEKGGEDIVDHAVKKNKVPQILLAEDDYEMRRLLASSLRVAGFEIIECSDGYQLLDHMGKPVFRGHPDDFDLIISDIRMPGITGLEVLEGIHDSEWFMPMILITAFGDEETHADAARLGAAAIFDKPFEIDELLAKVKEVLVLDSPYGNNWSPGTWNGDAGIDLPIDIVYSHILKSEFIETEVRREATRLLRLGPQILYCRVVMIGPHERNNSNRYHIQIMVTIPDKVFVVRSNLLKIADYQGLVESIPVAFKVVAGRIRKYLKMT